MKKIVTMLLLIAMVSTFVACSQKTSTPEAQTTETESSASEASTSEAPVSETPASEVPVSEAPVSETPAPDDSGKEVFFGEWVLNTIDFYTPDEDNGIYVIDASMSIGEGFEYGRDLSLSEDMKMVSLIDLNSLIEVVPELPFIIDDLNLKDYTGWTYSDGTLTLTPDGPALTASYDEASEELRLTRSGEVEITSTTNNGMVTKSGTVLIDITMVFSPK